MEPFKGELAEGSVRIYRMKEIMEQNFRKYENLAVWQNSMEVVKIVYEFTSMFPKSEMLALSSQMRRCAVSIPSNIAEGYRRGGSKEFAHFLRFSYGSGAELETQIKVAQMLSYGSNFNLETLHIKLNSVMKLLHTMLKNTKQPLA